MEDPKIKIHTYQEIELKNAMVVISFPTIGMISNIVGNFLIKNLNLKRMGAIVSDQFQPAAIIQDGIPAPPVRIYAGEHICGPDGQCDQLVVITSDLPIDKKVLANLADTIIDWVSQNGCEVIVTIEGINAENLEIGDEASVYHVLSQKNVKHMVKDLDSKPLENGMVSGLSGLLLWKGNLANFPITSILSEAHKKFPDSRSAASVLKALNKMLPEINMDPEPLLEKAEEIEAQIRKGLQQMKQDSNKSVGKAAEGFFA